MSSVYRIGDLVLHTGRQEVTRAGQPVHLGPLSYRFLLALVEAAPGMASHDALAAAVWRGRAVSPETISQRGKLLREALGDDPRHPRYVEVLRGRGYRLVPPVVASVPATRGPRARLRAFGIAAALVLAAAVGAWRLYAPEPAPSRSPSIAVLPFADMSSGQDQEYFADGMAEEILDLLSRTTPLKVTARTSSFSFKGKNDDIPRIVEKLNVDYVLEGSVRRSENHVRIAVRLVSGADGTHVWSDTYDRELRDVLELQREIAASVAVALEVNLLGQAPMAQAGQRVKPEAFDAYLRGRQQMQSLLALAEAERNFERAIGIDPGFIPAYSSLGLVYMLRIMDLQVPLAEHVGKLRAIVRQGLAIAPDDSGLIGLSGQLARYDGNMQLAEQRLEQAFELDPADVTIVMNYAIFKLDQGYPREALGIARRLLTRDPLNPIVYTTIIASQMDLGNAAEVARAAELHMDATAVPSQAGFWLRGFARMMLSGDFAAGITDLATAADVMTDGATRSYSYPVLYYDLGDVETGDAAFKVYRELFGEAHPDYTPTLAYRDLVTGDVGKARATALNLFTRDKRYSAYFMDILVAYLATDALIAAGEAGRAVELIERLAPVYATYRSTPYIPPGEFSPAPYPVKGTHSSYPALYFPLYIRALRAAGDAAGAGRMLGHLEAILRLRRQRGLFTRELHVAEARALRGDPEGALDALEQAERDRTIYLWWHVFLLHNGAFADIRHHARFEALVARVEREMRRQRAELHRMNQAMR